VIRFRLPGGAVDSFPPEATEMLRHVCPHEVGHALVARYFGANVYGIALSRVDGGMEAAAIYETSITMGLKDWCTIKAAGPAGEVIVFGRYGRAGARRDVDDVQSRGWVGNFDILVRQATFILQARQERFDRLTRALCNRILESDEIIAMAPLRLGRIGAYLLGEDEFAGDEKD
jgi:hypothetical protein